MSDSPIHDAALHEGARAIDVSDYDPYSERVLDDPYPFYRALREASPVHYLERWNTWALARFDDIWDASTDNDHFTAEQGTSTQYLLTKTIPPLPNLNHMDPPAHTRLRAALAPWFMPRRVRSLADTIRSYVGECIDAFIEAGRGDVIGDLGQIVAVRVATVAVGFPESDAAYIVDLVKRFLSREEGTVGMTETGVAAFEEMIGYLEGLAKARRSHTGSPENPIDVLLRAEVEGERLSDELVGQHLILLLVGATETFPKVFATSVLRLAEHPDQRAELARNPALIPRGLRECLRYDMPTQFLMRVVKAPVEIRGQRLEPGQPVMFLYPSGNRDEREFDDPDRFDIHRESPRILSFGHGTHRCLGAHFAEAEGRILLEELLGRIPDYDVRLDEARRDRTEFIRGYSALPIEFTPGGRTA
jgi:cytochrome P450